MTLFTQEELNDFMTADSARKQSMMPQLQKCMKEIQDSICNGQKHTTFMFESVYPEVAEALATLGYDVEIKEDCNALDSRTTVNWSKAEPDKKGTVTYK